jgi:hypothetical protein
LGRLQINQIVTEKIEKENGCKQDYGYANKLTKGALHGLFRGFPGLFNVKIGFLRCYEAEKNT